MDGLQRRCLVRLLYSLSSFFGVDHGPLRHFRNGISIWAIADRTGLTGRATTACARTSFPRPFGMGLADKTCVIATRAGHPQSIRRAAFLSESGCTSVAHRRI